MDASRPDHHLHRDHDSILAPAAAVRAGAPQSLTGKFLRERREIAW
jgi:hypothetical protein